MATDPIKLDDLEMLSLLAVGLILYMERVAAGEKTHFPILISYCVALIN